MTKRVEKQRRIHIPQPKPKRASTGELLYLLLTFRDLVEYAPEAIRQQILDDTRAHCPTLFEAMQIWKANNIGHTTGWDAFTFTYKVPLPEAFQKDSEVPNESER